MHFTFVFLTAHLLLLSPDELGEDTAVEDEVHNGDSEFFISTSFELLPVIPQSDLLPLLLRRCFNFVRNINSPSSSSSLIKQSS